MTGRRLFSGMALALCLGRFGDSAAAASMIECTVAAMQAKAPPGTTVTSGSVVDATESLPQYCRVDGRVATPGNEVNFRLGLPASWNGKFYFVGVGGLAGTIGSLDAGLARGYASASTDTGHEASDPNWGSNRAKEIDYGHRGTHVTAVAAKALTTAYFGKQPRPRVFQRLFERRTPGAHGGTAVSGGFRRHHRWRSGHRDADAGRTGPCVPTDAPPPGELPSDRKSRAAVTGDRELSATRRMA